MSAYLFCILFCILESEITFFACTDLNNIFNVVYKYFTITDLTCMKDCFGSFDNFLYRYQADNNLNLDLRKKIHFYFNTTIVGWSTFLYTASENVRNSDTCNTDLVHCLHKFIKLILTGDDNNFCKFMKDVYKRQDMRCLSRMVGILKMKRNVRCWMEHLNCTERLSLIHI